jgi:hypothetical protein
MDLVITGLGGIFHIKNKELKEQIALSYSKHTLPNNKLIIKFSQQLFDLIPIEISYNVLL